MAFNLKDFNNLYHKKGNYEILFNVARTDESATSPQYYLFLSDEGAYVIMRKTVSSGISTFEYYAAALVEISTNTKSMTTDWANRASLSYVEYNEIL